MYKSHSLNLMIGYIDAALRQSDDLRKTRYRDNPNYLAGHCYVASEALYHVCGGKDSEFTPQVICMGEGSHWFLRNKHTGEIVDITAGQFNEPLDYSDARGCGFLTAEPSKRCQELIERTWAKIREVTVGQNNHDELA